MAMTDSNATELCFSDGCRDPEVTGGWPDEFDSNATLLPCPFCGGDAHVFAKHYENDDHEWWVGCIKCGATLPGIAAIEAWNTRTPEQAVDATLGRPTWRNSYDQERYDRWHNSLHHEGEPSNFTELVEDIIWTCETVDLGPNGNTCQGVDEGEVNTESLIRSWAEKAATLGAPTLTAEQVRKAVEAGSWPETSTLREFNGSSWQAIADELNEWLRGKAVKR